MSKFDELKERKEATERQLEMDHGVMDYDTTSHPLILYPEDIKQIIERESPWFITIGGKNTYWYLDIRMTTSGSNVSVKLYDVDDLSVIGKLKIRYGIDAIAVNSGYAANIMQLVPAPTPGSNALWALCEPWESTVLETPEDMDEWLRESVNDPNSNTQTFAVGSAGTLAWRRSWEDGIPVMCDIHFCLNGRQPSVMEVIHTLIWMKTYKDLLNKIWPELNIYIPRVNWIIDWLTFRQSEFLLDDFRK